MRSLLITILLFSTSTGCSLFNPRYAMNDPVYAQKYAKQASPGDFFGKLKQATDARHNDKQVGWLVGGGTQVNSNTIDTLGTIELGREIYDTSYLSHRVSLSGFTGNNTSAFGAEAGVRLQTPTRLAPFVGIGGFGGIRTVDAVTLGLEAWNESNNPLDLLDEELPTESVNGLATFYPEVGAHFWIDGNIRLSGFGRYTITSEGRDYDGWMVGGQVTLFGR
ncbi:MAG: hypothetical protein ACPHO8_06640 [Mariniblastus sp.]